MKKLFLSFTGLTMMMMAGAAFADHTPFRVFQAAPMLAGPDTVETPGSEQGAAWLRRTRDRVDGRIMVNVDQPGTAYSVWWVVFNRPHKCAGFMNVPKTPCMLPDLFNPQVKAAVFNASGAISTDNGSGGGVINVDLDLIAGEGAHRGHAGFPPLPELEGTLRSGKGCGAEIHIDVNQHDEFDTDWLTELTTPEGMTHRFAIFPRVKCRRGDHDDDWDDDWDD